MKNKTFFRTAVFALLFASCQALFGFTTVNTKHIYKLKSAHVAHLSARLVQYDFYFTDGSGNSVTLSGRGAVYSGNINYFIAETFSTGTVASGTASGTYSIDTSGNCTIDVTFTATGHSQEYYSGAASYSSI